MSTRKMIYHCQEYYFNFEVFNELCSEEKQKRKITFNKLEEELSDICDVSIDAIHNWRFRKNGPADIGIVKSLTEYFHQNNPTVLLTKKSYDKKDNLDELQKSSVKRIYDSIIEYLDVFERTNGFNDLWHELDIDNNKKENVLYDIVGEYMSKLHLVLKKEHIFLKDTNIYDELINYEYNDLYDTYDGKLSYAYRFEAIPDENPTTEDDYYKALDKLNDIVDKYI